MGIIGVKGIHGATTAETEAAAITTMIIGTINFTVIRWTRATLNSIWKLRQVSPGDL